VVAGLAPYLNSTTDTIRRSAIYVLWKGGYSDLTPVLARLQELMKHAEDLTRGMAALALGQNRVAGSFDSLADMLRNDVSGYARRCAAIALGWLGNPHAEPLLTEALKDSEALVRQNATAALEMLKKVKETKPPPSDAVPPSAPSAAFASARLNADQRRVLEWTDRQFRSFFDQRTFAGWSDKEKADLEAKLLDALKGPRTRDYYVAINSLAALGSTNALPALRDLAFDRRDKDNRDRWMSIRALGILCDKASAPEFIHLVYHGNANTRWWAQLTLVRLTSQNFGSDWKAWQKWWNESGGQPPCSSEIVRWWGGQAEPEKLAESLAESDRKFLEGLR
jgi:HEAT repeat protein